MMSLPHLLGISHAPNDTGGHALSCLPIEAQCGLFGGMSAFPGMRANIGIAWIGSTRRRCIDRFPRRSLRSLNGRSVVCVPQSLVWRADRFRQINAAAAPQFPIAPIGWPSLVDFAEVAALVANLDGVVTIDTAVAHLAGAIGKRTFVLLNYAPDWRWFSGRTDSPWYPTVKLFRQKKPLDWQIAAG